jgi:hypothetical protein
VEKATTQNSTKKVIKKGKIVSLLLSISSYFIGVFILLGAFVSISQSFVAFVIFAFAGLLCLPIIHKQINKLTKRNISGFVYIPVVFVLFIIGAIASPESSSQNNSNSVTSQSSSSVDTEKQKREEAEKLAKEEEQKQAEAKKAEEDRLVEEKRKEVEVKKNEEKRLNDEKKAEEKSLADEKKKAEYLANLRFNVDDIFGKNIEEIKKNYPGGKLNMNSYFGVPTSYEFKIKDYDVIVEWYYPTGSYVVNYVSVSFSEEKCEAGSDVTNRAESILSTVGIDTGRLKLQTDPYYDYKDNKMITFYCSSPNIHMNYTPNKI